MTQVIASESPSRPTGVLTGPNLAAEVLAGDATAAVVATENESLRAQAFQVFSTETFRVYTSEDVIGCELGGAFKNVLALAVGMTTGLGTGDNTRAAVVTRGLAELARLDVEQKKKDLILDTKIALFEQANPGVGPGWKWEDGKKVFSDDFKAFEKNE